MDEIAIIVLLVVSVVLLPIILSIVALVKASGARRRVDELEQQLKLQEMAWSHLKRETPPQPSAPPVPATIVPVSTPAPAASPLPKSEHVPINREQLVVTKPVSVSPSALPPVISQPVEPSRAPINWEQFMGVKIFAWLGGFVLFLGIVFFLKYAFENHLISAQLQVALEYVVAAGLLGTGVWLTRREGLAAGPNALCDRRGGIVRSDVRDARLLRTRAGTGDVWGDGGGDGGGVYLGSAA